MSEELDRIEIRARQFAADNPEVWQLFCRFTFELIHAGRDHYSADAVFHRIRWHTAVETQGDEFKLNDHYTACFARWFHAAFPKYDGFFRLRRRPAKD